jgi:nicotinamidase-related amidase
MKELQRFHLDRDKAVLVVIDVQEKLVPTMDCAWYAQLRGNLEVLLQAAEMMRIPVLATEQYPRGLGSTVSELQAACREVVVEKVTFGCCGEPVFLDKLKALGRTQVIVTGMEAHVCVYQTVLGLLETGYHVHLVRDGIISRHEADFLVSVENAARAGAVVTSTEIVLFQLLQSSKAPEFKAISALIKNKG